MAKVIASIIFWDVMLFATQRGYGEWENWWDFPGILGYYSLGNNLLL